MEKKVTDKIEEPTQTPEIKAEESNHETHKSSKLPIIVIVLLLILLVPLGGYFLVNEASKAKVTPTPTQTQNETSATSATTSPTKSISPTAASVQLDKSFTSAKFSDLSFSGYKLSYPSSWSLSEQRDGSVPISTVTLTKNGYTLKIYQAATGGAMCVYEGSLPEGPASDYRTSKFTDLTTSFGTLRQTESPSNGKMVFVYCQKSTNDGGFGQPTSVGHMSVTTGVASPDAAIVAEIEAIVKSIETLK